MKKYSLTDKLNFGIYKGEDLKFIYTFDPLYVEYLIKTLDHFYINIDDFQDLHTNQIDKKNEIQEIWFGKYTANNELMSLRKYMEEYTDLIEKNYYNTPKESTKHSFSKETLNILNEKKIMLNIRY